MAGPTIPPQLSVDRFLSVLRENPAERWIRVECATDFLCGIVESWLSAPEEVALHDLVNHRPHGVSAGPSLVEDLLADGKTE